MAATGGRVPFDKTNAGVGPARVLWGLPTVAVPTDMYDVVPGVATALGEYPAKTGWNDFGLAADAPTYTHDKDTDGLEYQNTPATLFEQVSAVNRSFTAQIAEISPENFQIIENAPSISTIAAAAGKAAQKKLAFGAYSSFKQYRIAMVFFRPTGAGAVTEPAPSLVGTRPPAVCLVLPNVTLAADGTDIDISRSDPVNAQVQFKVYPDPTLPAGQEHGFWIFEQPGAIT